MDRVDDDVSMGPIAFSLDLEQPIEPHVLQNVPEQDLGIDEELFPPDQRYLQKERLSWFDKQKLAFEKRKWRANMMDPYTEAMYQLKKQIARVDINSIRDLGTEDMF